MAYLVEFAEPVLEYLKQVAELTDADREAIIEGVVEELAQHTDRWLALRPLAHESLCFRLTVDYEFQDAKFSYDFIVSAEFMAMGVVRVVYVESATS